MKYNGVVIPAELERALVEKFINLPARVALNKIAYPSKEIDENNSTLLQFFILIASLFAAGILLHWYYQAFGLINF